MLSFFQKKHISPKTTTDKLGKIVMWPDSSCCVRLKDNRCRSVRAHSRDNVLLNKRPVSPFKKILVEDKKIFDSLI